MTFIGTEFTANGLTNGDSIIRSNVCHAVGNKPNWSMDAN